jgi:O-antigen/teichoic acid export membrane protein
LRYATCCAGKGGDHLPDATLNSAGAPEPVSVGPVLRSQILGTSAIYILGTVGVRFASLLLLPVYARLLVPSEYGIYAVAETTAAIATSLFGIGVDSAIRRYYLEYCSDDASISSFVSTLWRTSLLFALILGVSGIVALKAAYAVLGNKIHVAFWPYVVVSVCTCVVVQPASFVQALYQMQQRAKAWLAFTVVGSIATALVTVSLLLFLHAGALGMLLGKLTAGILLLVLARILLGRHLRAPFSRRVWEQALKLILPLAGYPLAAFGLTFLDRLILQYYRNLEEVGIYSLAYTLGMSMNMLAASVVQAWAPPFFGLAARNDRVAIGRYTRLLLGVFTLVAVFGIILSGYVVRGVLPSRYSATGPLVPWIIAAYWFRAATYLFQQPVLQGGRSGLITVSGLVALVINVFFNLWLIPSFGAMGAAVATIVAYAVECGLTYGCAQRVFAVLYGRLQTLVYLLVGIGALCVSQITAAAGSKLAWNVAALVLLSTVTVFAAGRNAVRSAWASLWQS